MSVVHNLRLGKTGDHTPTLIGEITLDVQLLVRDWIKEEVIWAQDVGP
jgi:hypothetical protein